MSDVLGFLLNVVRERSRECWDIPCIHNRPEPFEVILMAVEMEENA